MTRSPEEHFSAGFTGEVQETLGQTVDSLFEFVALFTPDGKVTYLNRSARELVLDGKPMPANFSLADLQPEWAAAVLREEGFPNAQRDGSWRGETALLRADGTELPV